ncbi:MAG TPA: protein kinase, partial [Amnibacterium sp.]|nr:protein kinase [Amnibacterium sp.]
MTDGPGSSAGEVVGGRYRLEGELGRGGMAVVWRATDLKLDRTVAVKVFRSELAEAVDPQRTARETHLLAGMQHPAVVGALDASTGDADVTYLVMELVEGDDLKTLLHRGPLDPDLTRRVLADVADALALLHSRGVVHRDVKPANILVVRAPERRATGITAKLTDFGIAQAVDATRITSSDIILGTAAYLSPEQVRGDPVGPASDVYAAGLVLAECLSGRRAFPGPPAEAAVARLSAPPPLPEGASAELAALLTAMTAMDPVERPAASAVAATLRDLAGSMTEPEDADTARVPRPASFLPAAALDLAGFDADGLEAPPERRRRPLLLPVIAAAVIAVLGGTGALLSSPLLFGGGLLPRHVAAPAASGGAVPPGDAVTAGPDTPLPTSPAPSSAAPRLATSTGRAAGSGSSRTTGSSSAGSSGSPSGRSSATPSSSAPRPSATASRPTPTATATATPTPAPTASASPSPTPPPAPTTT